MTSKIEDIKISYGKYSEVLPDELCDNNVENDLRNNNLQMHKIFDADISFIKELINKCHIKINLQDYENSDAYLIRKGFLLRNENVDERQEIKYFIAHLFMCKSTLSYLADTIFESLHNVKEIFTKLKKTKTTLKQPIPKENVTRQNHCLWL